MRARRLVRAIVVVLIIGATTLWLVSYHSYQFRGAGPVKDRGILSHYRYQAPLGEIPLAKAGTYRLRFSGLPSESLVPLLYVPGAKNDSREPFASLTTQLTVEISDATGNVICAASGSLAGESWRLYSSPDEGAFWHTRCNGVPFSRHTEYELVAHVSDVDPRSPNVQLMAMLEWGGIELP